MLNNLTAEIAGIVFTISTDRPISAMRIEPSYQDFISSREADITIHNRYDGLPGIQLRDEDKIFDSQMVWSLYQVDGRNVFVLNSPVFGLQPYRLAIFDKGCRQGEVHNVLPETTESLLPNPLEFPLSEVLMICLLAKERGLMVHACGIEDGGRGYLFAGNSTHGKTTVARLWKDQATILNDDRIVLRQHDGRFWMYGTPWHGEYSGVSSRGVPLERIFFLNHAPDNSTCCVGGAAAVSGLLARSFPPLWDADGMRFTLDFCSRLAAEIPFHHLDFIPGKDLLNIVRSLQ